MSIRIDKEFESLIPPLSDDEFKQLEENCVKEGIRDALVVCKVPNGDQIFVDEAIEEYATKNLGMQRKDGHQTKWFEVGWDDEFDD